MKNWKEVLKKALLYILALIFGAGGGAAYLEATATDEATYAVSPETIEVYTDIIDETDPEAYLTYWDCWVQYKVNQKLDIENPKIIPDAGFTTSIYYTHRFYMAIEGSPSLTWVNKMVRPPFGGEAVKFLKLEKRK